MSPFSSSRFFLLPFPPDLRVASTQKLPWLRSGFRHGVHIQHAIIRIRRVVSRRVPKENSRHLRIPSFQPDRPSDVAQDRRRDVLPPRPKQCQSPIPFFPLSRRESLVELLLSLGVHCLSRPRGRIAHRVQVLRKPL